ncbi:ENO2 [Symbiodinium sp. KB8]|nr:ENO2 [Symbiodinium sp. KB8]
MFSYSKACATIEHITEADVPVLEALDQEELAWLLRVSARFDHMTAAKGLLAARASVNHITPHHSAGAYNALHEACRYNANVDMLLLMLQARGDPDVKTRCKNNPRTALQIAEGEGHASLAQWLRPQEPAEAAFSTPKPMPSQVQETGSRPLTFSFTQAHFLLEHVAEEDSSVLTALGSEETAWLLRVAAGFNQLTAAKALLSGRASVDVITHHRTGGALNALQAACVWKSSADMLQLLLEADADANIKTYYKGHQRTALQIAEAENHDDLARCLHDFSAKVAAPHGSSTRSHSWSSRRADRSNEYNYSWAGRDEGKTQGTHDEPNQHRSTSRSGVVSSDSVCASRPTQRSRSPAPQTAQASSSSDWDWRSSDAMQASSVGDWWSSQSPRGSGPTQDWASSPKSGGWQSRDWSGDGNIEVVAISRVAYLQKTCTSTFKDGRTLQQTTEELKSGQLDPFSHENFILSALKCNVRHEGRWQDLYWSKDHRRLVCMRRAGCTHVRLRIDRIESRKFQPIMRKLIASVGHSTDIEVLDTAKR